MVRSDILRTGQISQLLGVNVRTTLGWIERGDLKAYQLPGRGDNRVLRSDLLEFLSRHGMPVPEELSEGSPRVLILGKDLRQSRRVADALRSAGIETQTTGSVFLAGVRLASFRPDVLVLDLKVPGLGEADALRVIRAEEDYRRTKILAVAALPRREVVRRLKAGADLVLRTPVTPGQVLDAVRELLGARKQDEPRPTESPKRPALPEHPRLLLVGRAEECRGGPSAGRAGQGAGDPPLVDFTRSVNEAVRRLTDERYDALVCWAEQKEDLAAVIRIRRKKPEVPIVVVTSRRDSDFRGLASKMGAARVLGKPARLSGLLETVRLAVRNGELAAGVRIRAHEAHEHSRELHALSREIMKLAGEAVTRSRARPVSF